ncbi:MAG: lipid-binding SYLF domain-containing protein [Pseudomonadota bacterium]
MSAYYRIVRNSLVALVASVLLIPAAQARKLTMDERLTASAEVIATFNDIPEKAIPPALLRRAHAIVVIPDMVKFGFVVAGRHGKGVMTVRDGERWSAPLFVSLTGGSVGWQAGLQSSDIVLIFTNKAGVENIARGKFTLGADASIAAGPLGRHGSAATDKSLSAEVYSYSRSRGLFAGVSVDGAKLSIDRKANAAYYVSPDISATQIMAGDIDLLPPSARTFRQQLPGMLQPDTKRSADEAPDQRTLSQGISPPDETTEAKVYPIGERAASGSVEPKKESD